MEGPIGLRGPTGAQGNTGPRGPQGVAGPQGPTGSQGITGPIGKQGLLGFPNPVVPVKVQMFVGNIQRLAQTNPGNLTLELTGLGYPALSGPTGDDNTYSSTTISNMTLERNIITVPPGRYLVEGGASFPAGPDLKTGSINLTDSSLNNVFIPGNVVGNDILNVVGRTSFFRDTLIVNSNTQFRLAINSTAAAANVQVPIVIETLNSNYPAYFVTFIKV